MATIQDTVSDLRQLEFDFFCDVRKIYADYLLDVPFVASVKLRSVLISFDTFYNGRDVRNTYRAASFHEFLAFVYDYVAWEFENRQERNDYNIVWDSDEDELAVVHLTDDFKSAALSIADQVAEYISDVVTSSSTIDQIELEWMGLGWRPDFPFETRAAKIEYSIDN